MKKQNIGKDFIANGFKFKGRCINPSMAKGGKKGGGVAPPGIFFDNFFRKKFIKNPDIEKNSISILNVLSP